MKTPWHDKKGKIHFSYRAILDRVFIFQDPLPEKFESKESLIKIPEQFKKFHREGIGIILSIGPGYQDDNGKWHLPSDQVKPGTRVRFDKTVPWGFDIKGLDGKMHSVIICGYTDLYGVIE